MWRRRMRRRRRRVSSFEVCIFGTSTILQCSFSCTFAFELLHLSLSLSLSLYFLSLASCTVYTLECLGVAGVFGCRSLWCLL